MSTGEREIWIDWMRVVACFLVIMTHSCEPFYLGGEDPHSVRHLDGRVRPGLG